MSFGSFKSVRPNLSLLLVGMGTCHVLGLAPCGCRTEWLDLEMNFCSFSHRAEWGSEPGACWVPSEQQEPAGRSMFWASLWSTKKTVQWMLGPKYGDPQVRPFLLLFWESPCWKNTRSIILHSDQWDLINYCQYWHLYFYTTQNEPQELPSKVPQEMLAEPRVLKDWVGCKCLDRLDCLSVCSV